MTEEKAYEIPLPLEEEENSLIDMKEMEQMQQSEKEGS